MKREMKRRATGFEPRAMLEARSSKLIAVQQYKSATQGTML